MQRRNTDIYRRGRELRKGRPGAGPVVYWMSREQRVDDNWPLLFAQQEAVIHEKGLLVVLCLTPDLPGTNPAQVEFIVRGLSGIAVELQRLGIGWTVLQDHPGIGLPRLLRDIDAHGLVCDFNPLNSQRTWLNQLAEQLSIPMYEVDGHNIIPAWTVSPKKEYAAYTIRPRIGRLLDDFLTDIPPVSPHGFALPAKVVRSCPLWTVPFITGVAASKAPSLQSGPEAAREAARKFVAAGLAHYNTGRNDPCRNGQSGLSPYLHCGQLSAQRLALMVRSADVDVEAAGAFMEELVVRRELSDNFCLYESRYDSFDGFPEWARKTLDLHRRDKREYAYSLDALEAAETHEVLWNCCQRDLVHSGKLHGFLRMYWAKKILEWSPAPETALACAIELNDRYSIDGHDPNGYTGVAWSVGGVHDRAWAERPVFGKIRYMNEAGCRRKFDVASYIEEVGRRTGPAGA
jgi:deoxyribodipyrimidine photo-lyase